MTTRFNALAERLEQGALELEKFANGLTEAQWQLRGTKDTRKVGVTVHHVATVYPLEIQLAQTVAAGKPVLDLTWDTIHNMNAKHSSEYDGVTKADTWLYSGVTALRQQPQYELWTTGIWIAQLPCRSTQTLHSPASFCWRITQCDTAITTSPFFALF